MSNLVDSQIPKEKGTDWDKDDILYALKKKGFTLCGLSRQSGLGSRTLNNSLYRRWPKGDRIIASALGREIAQIWPSRYPEE